MNITERAVLKINNTIFFTSEIPIKCPYCDAFVEPSPCKQSNVPYNDSTKIYIVTFFVKCCKKQFFATYQTSSGSTAKLLNVYPPQKPEKLPDAIKDISPRFVNLYNQVFLAEINNHFELAGAGYRNALEILIKDYAIKELGKPEKEVCKKSLNDAIQAYMQAVTLSTSADVVRLLGNDYTHYERKYDDIEFRTLKSYLKIFINAIENEHLINHPPVPTKDRHSQTS